MSYSYIIAPQSLEDRLLKAKLHGANVDMGRFADLIDMAYTERYLDDPAYARRIHAELRALV